MDLKKKKDYELMLKNVKKFKNIKVFYLPGSSIYECLNLGINKSSGTIINIMGDDDQYYNKDIFRNIFKKISSGIDYIYGDTIYQKNGKEIRYYKSFEMKKNLMTIAYMPSHTSLFLKKIFTIHLVITILIIKLLQIWNFSLGCIKIKDINMNTLNK